MSVPTPVPVPSYDLVGPMVQAIIDTPGIWWNVFVSNPGPWLPVIAIFAGLVVLRVFAGRFSRKRRVTRR